MEACRAKPTSCEEYNCLYLDCWCSPNKNGEIGPLYSSNKEIKTEKEAEEIAKIYMSKAEPNATFGKSGDQGNGWFFVTFENVENDKNGHLSISPRGDVLWTECGV
ncbi:MAG: hypothetical protein GY810_12730 [Aureispira sp.]|nr:hypothetical protein [Aureispira sp.]